MNTGTTESATIMGMEWSLGARVVPYAVAREVGRGRRRQRVRVLMTTKMNEDKE